MKSTIVPAQITTVEDRIAGNFTFSQLAVLTAPVAISASMYILLAPKLQLSLVKFLLMAVVFVVICPLAIRIRDKTVAAWLVLYTRYALRPRVYVHTKADPVHRTIGLSNSEPTTEIETGHEKKPAAYVPQPVHEQLRIKELLEDPALSVSFEFAQNGGVDVSLTPVKR
jgi:hypothetical protein